MKAGLAIAAAVTVTAIDEGCTAGDGLTNVRREQHNHLSHSTPY